MKKRKPLSIDERISIVHKVLVVLDKQADVAKDFRVSASVVAALVRKIRANPSVFREILSKRNLNDLK